MSPGIPRRADRRSAPLSAAQERVWVALGRKEAVAPLSITLALDGALAQGALVAAVAALARRHPILGATVSSAAGRPVQAFGDRLPQVVTIEEADAADAASRARADAAQPFDLGSAPMWRVSALRVAPARTLVVVTVHPLIADATSLAIFARDLAATLGGAALEPLARDYGDFAAWQRRWLTSDAAEGELAHRAERLAQLPVVVPASRGASAGEQNCRVPGDGVIWRPLEQTCVAALRALARETGASVELALLAIFAVLLGRLSGQEEVGVALAARARGDPALADVLGDLGCDVVVPVDLRGTPGLRELLRRASDASTWAEATVPLDRVQERVPDGVRRVAARVESMPRIDALPAASLALAATAVAIPARPTLDLRIDDDGRRMQIALAHDGSLHDRAQLAVMADQLAALVGQAVAAADTPAGRWSLVTAATRGVLPDPRVPIAEPAQEPVSETIARVAQRAPQAVAIAQGAHGVSYAALVSASNRVAQALVGAGVARGDVVVVAGTLCPGLFIAMLGVLASGAALLALDGTVPAARRTQMLRDARAKHVLCAGRAPFDDPSLPRIDVDPATGAIAVRAGDGAALPAIAGDDPAYVFFTSGTTGAPKAVLGRHKSLAHFLQWQRETFAIGAADRAAQLTGLTFNVMLRDIFAPLTAGATLCLPPLDWAAMGAAALVAWLAAERITLLHGVPSVMHAWLSAAREPRRLPLRIVFSGGEPLSAALVERWCAAFGPQCRMVNFYGMTEATTARTWYEIPPVPRPGIQSVGRPLPQVDVLVLTAAGDLAGVGEPGEIVVRSPFLAAGYLNAPGDTRFRRNPFGGDDGDRVFVTGDRGCYETDGTLTILGRADDQLKIRGVRVEPAEVAAVLQGHPGVAQGVVVAQGEGPARALAAYVVARGAAPPVRELRAWLGARVPEAMVPPSFTFVDGIPVTASGKIDRAALPAPRRMQAASVAPRDDAEFALAAIWSDVLAVDDLGVTDDFFERGGDSLAAARVLARIRDEFGVDLAIAALFRATTVAELAREIARMRPEGPGRRDGA